MNTELQHIAVLAGGISHERDVSLRSGRRVAESLRQQGITVDLIDPDQLLFTKLGETAYDVVWPVLHGATGEDGTLSDLLELSGNPYVGSSADAARLAWDKPTAKVLLARQGIQTPESVSISKETFRDYGAVRVLQLLEDKLGTSLVVKPARGGSAQGVTIITDTEQLAQAMVSAFTYYEVALIERQITGTEVAVSIIDTGDGPVALPPVEIVPRSGVYSFEARYNAGETDFFTPARLSADLITKVSQNAVLAHQILGLRDISRIDMIVDEQGAIWFLEANVMPGLTETSLLPLALEHAGHDLGWVYAALASAAAERAAK